MSAESHTAIDAATRLCDILEEIASALVRLDNEALLKAEVALAEIVGTFEANRPAGTTDRAEVEAVVKRGRDALMRCRRLGASFTGIARARLATLATTDTYDRAGAVGDPRAPQTTVRAAL